jgi:signal transduction histidine kinase/CheY-like chemotaxis protein
MVLILGLLWAGIGTMLWHDYAEAEQGAAKDTANLARSFEEDIARTVEAVDQTLLFIREAYQHDRSGVMLGAWTRGHAFLDDFQVQMSLTDRNGRVLWSNLGPVQGEVSLADREHFQAQKNSQDDALFISRPVLGRVSGRWTVQFVRKLLAPDGSFDGMVVVSLDPSYLSRFYGSISIGDGSVLLANIQGVVLARAPNDVPMIGRVLSDDTTARMLHGTTNGAFRAVSGIDQVERIFSSRRLNRYPLVLAVGLATAEVFAPYERNKRLYLAAGVVLSLACIVVGVVLLRQRQSLLDSRQSLSVTLENMSQGIAMVRADGSIPVLNHRAIELLELPAALMAGRPNFDEIVEWQHAHREFGEPASWDPTLARVIRENGQLYGDYTYERTRPDGVVLEVRTQAMADGGIVRTYTDVTERKRHEAALAAAQARAAHAERMQALGQLAGGIAHDFNNVLQAVQGGATLIEKRAADTASVQRFARMILDATERGTSITRRLLAFARRGELRAEPVEARELLLGLRDVLSHTLGSGVMVEVQLPEDLPPLLADKGQLETALVNLATNARDAMPNGGKLTFAADVETVGADAAELRPGAADAAELRPGAADAAELRPGAAHAAELRPGAAHAAELRPGLYVRLAVADTGTGMDQRTLVRVLEPFFSTKAAGHGTGLGLSMVKGFAEQSGGGLAIDSTPGSGTTVHLWLPAATRLDVAAEPEAPAAGVRDDSGKRILLVDDEAMIRETLAAALEEAGYSVLVAGGGAEALELLRSPASIDVLVTDLSMPGIDGLTVIRHAQRERAALPVVLLTGYTGHGAQLAVGGLVRGAFALVRKPVTAAQLADRIEALLAVTLAG